MSFEVACSECHGRLLVETPGVVVACPHCGTHLMIPESTAAATEEAATPDAPVPEATAVLRTGRDVESAEPAAPPPSIDNPPEIDNTERIEAPAPWSPPADGPAETFPDFSNFAQSEPSPPWTPPAPADDAPAFPDFAGAQSEAEAETASAVLTADDLPEEKPAPTWEAPAPDDVPVENATGFSMSGESGHSPAPAFTFEPAAAPASSPKLSEASAAAAPTASDTGSTKPATVPATTPTSSRKSARSSGTVPKNLFIAALSYASAVTIMLIYLLFSTQGADPHQLESLPDIVPPMDKDEIRPVLVPADAPMPKGHTLRLNETQRFGNVEVTPVRVTRGPIEFEHFSNPSQKKPAGPAVLKLWLRVRNVADDQAVIPFGKPLVFNRFPNPDDRTLERANNFVARRRDQQAGGPLELVYNLVVDDVWDLKGQNIDRKLQPNEEFETYIPSTPDATSLDGGLVWRVHFRKGYNPQSLRGVTTLIEVEFDSREIQTAS